MISQPKPSFPIPDLANRTSVRVQEFARYFEVTTQHVLNLIEEGSIHAVNCAVSNARTKRSTWRIPVSEVHRFAESRSSLCAAAPEKVVQHGAAGKRPITGDRGRGATVVPVRRDLAIAMPCNGNCNALPRRAKAP